MIPGTQYPSCKLCGELMWHIAQVYCPLLESNYHRTLNTFACIKSQCLKKHGRLIICLICVFLQYALYIYSKSFYVLVTITC